MPVAEHTTHEPHGAYSTSSGQEFTLSRQEIVSALDEGARRRRNISGCDLVRSYRAGRLADPGEVADLLVLADLLSEDDPIFSAS